MYTLIKYITPQKEVNCSIHADIIFLPLFLFLPDSESKNNFHHFPYEAGLEICSVAF